MNIASPTSSQEEYQLDPVFLHSRREAIIIFCLWLTGLAWAVPYCYINGYPDEFDPEKFRTTWGIPTWLFWGIFVPWIVADIFTTWFCFFYMKDDNLDRPGQAEAIPETMVPSREQGPPPSQGGARGGRR